MLLNCTLMLVRRDEGFHLLHIGQWDNDFRYDNAMLIENTTVLIPFAVLKFFRIGSTLLMMMVGSHENKFWEKRLAARYIS